MLFTAIVVWVPIANLTLYLFYIYRLVRQETVFEHP